MRLLSYSALAVLLGGALVSATAQETQRSETTESRDRTGASRTNQSDPEARIRYDDEGNRLHIDVDEEIRFRESRRDDEAWAREGQFDLRYDRDGNTLTGEGQGTLRLDEIGGDVARWWQSWWEEERRTRRTREQGAQAGASEFIRRHDRNDDGYLSRSELPQTDRSQFASIDANQDQYLSAAEIRRYGDHLYSRQTTSRNTATRNTATRNQTSAASGDQTWGEWWASWWSDDQSGNREQGSDRGARQFVSQHDNNEDGYISYREIPSRMRTEFARVDRNDDGFLSPSEIQHSGSLLFDRRNQDRTVARTTDSRSGADNQTWSEWWSSWWSNDASDAGSAGGAGQFLRQHDDNQDGYVSQREIPSRMRDEFSRVDRNDDGYLSRSEIEQGGTLLRESRTASREDGRRTASGDDQTWSEWWSSWWSESDQGSAEQIADQGAREFLQRHDDNDDGYLVRSELPSGMYDDFSQIDRNDDRYLTLNEIRTYASQTRSRGATATGRTGDSQSRGTTASGRTSDSQSPGYVTYILIIEPQQTEVQLRDLQQTYGLLRRLDANDDGQISRSELNQRREQAVAQWSEQAFQEMDEDSNRVLTQSEARGSVFGRQFDQFDRNGNDQLTLEEVRRSVQEKLSGQASLSRDTGSDSRR